MLKKAVQVDRVTLSDSRNMCPTHGCITCVTVLSDGGVILSSHSVVAKDRSLSNKVVCVWESLNLGISLK